MKKHNILKVVSISIFVVVLLTWLLPTASYSTQLTVGERAQMGITELFTYPSVVLQYFGQNLLYVLAVGGLYGVLYKTGAYRKVLDKIVDGFKGKEWLFLSVIAALFAVVTAGCGLTYAMILLFPFVISIILLMGYDKMVAAATTVGGVVVGMVGSLCSTEINYYANNYLSLKTGDGIVIKLVVLVLGLALLIFNITRAKIGKKKADKELVNEYLPEATKAKTKVWPLVTILDIAFVVMCLAVFAWSGMFKITAFETATKGILGWKVGGFALVGKIFGAVPAFGSWTLVNLAILLVITTIVIAIVYKVKLDDYLDGFGKGAKKAIVPALIIALIYTVLIINTYNPVQLTIFSALLKLTKGFNVLTTSIVAFISGLFNVDFLYSAYNVVPYLTSLVTDKTLYPLIAVIFQSMYGVAMLVGPTSVILMITLYYLDIPYCKWLKYIWKLLLELVVVLFVVFLIVLVI